MKKFALLTSSIRTLVNRQHSTNILFVRQGQTNQNLKNTLQGWTDSYLTVRGREQANELTQSIFPFRNQFTHIFSSDLSRAKETAEISLGFPPDFMIIEDKRLRELFFGQHENIAFSMLDQEVKDAIFTKQYQAPDGESWQQVQERAMNFIKERCTANGTYLIYSHGGVICSITQDLEQQEVLNNNCGCIALEFDVEQKKMKQILFKWDFPKDEQEI